jgi:hypothetical protein
MVRSSTSRSAAWLQLLRVVLRTLSSVPRREKWRLTGIRFLLLLEDLVVEQSQTQHVLWLG